MLSIKPDFKTTRSVSSKKHRRSTSTSSRKKAPTTKSLVSSKSSLHSARSSSLHHQSQHYLDQQQNHAHSVSLSKEQQRTLKYKQAYEKTKQLLVKERQKTAQLS
jgi:hypothetical protein